MTVFLVLAAILSAVLVLQVIGLPLRVPEGYVAVVLRRSQNPQTHTVPGPWMRLHPWTEVRRLIRVSIDTGEVTITRPAPAGVEVLGSGQLLCRVVDPVAAFASAANPERAVTQLLAVAGRGVLLGAPAERDLRTPTSRLLGELEPILTRWGMRIEAAELLPVEENRTRDGR